MFMGEENFKNISIRAIVNDDPIGNLEDEDVYMVWFCKTLQNAKGLFSTDKRRGVYWECTYNGDKNELYVDSYLKEYNKEWKLDAFQNK